MLSDKAVCANSGCLRTVLILVLMEDALWRIMLRSFIEKLNVLILVLMEDALWPVAQAAQQPTAES